MASINGIAHIQLSVSNMERSIPFYETLLHSMEMATLVKSPQFFYCIGGRTGVAISPIEPAFREQGFTSSGRACITSVFARGDEWAPGYYSVLFEDPDGIRIEANYVPGKGHLA